MCGEKPHGSSGFFRRWDYPRVCGEKSRCGTFALQIPGSPPRVRGKVFGQNFQYFPSGITPACAGKRKQEHGQKNRSGDHPRVCGEKCACTAKPMPLWGSPPRMRGKVPTIPVSIHSLGITPACAGKRADCPTWGCTGWDHPRVCGEKHAVPVSLMWSAGSPPRVRGKGLLEVFVPEPLRITPAYAGKSAAQSLDRLCAGDHPRVCGEKQGVPAVAGRNLGSPPRMRGKVLPLLHSPHPPGITPACAGKRLRIGVRYAQRKDHPRVCGEKRQGNMNKEVKVGSPPRMRGKASHHEVCVLVLGITPAYAGKSSTATLAAHSTGDHPRVCGEKRSRFKRDQNVKGSPPRMRGKVLDALRPVSMCRITPAYAGKSRRSRLRSRPGWDHPRVCGEKPLVGYRGKAPVGSPPRMRGKACG